MAIFLIGVFLAMLLYGLVQKSRLYLIAEDGSYYPHDSPVTTSVGLLGLRQLLFDLYGLRHFFQLTGST